MLGAIIGDIVGSVYEFNNYRFKDFQPFYHRRAFFTDDTVCTVAIADALVRHIDPAVALRTWGMRYEKNGGWGLRFAEWLADPDAGPYDSLGNGAGMRISAAGLLSRTLDEALFLSDRATEVTHNHPEGMAAARATSQAIYLARRGTPPQEIRHAIERDFGYDLSRSVDQIRPGYRYNELARDTTPQALTCALEATDFEDAIRNAISIGGDSDTIAAIAGGVAEAMFGIPEDLARQAWQKLPLDMQEAITALYETAERRSKHPKTARLTVVQGNIVAQEDCDGIVNAANPNLRAGSGVCGAIHRAAGPALETYCIPLGPLPIGHAIVTPGFQLNRTVIHTVGPKYLFDPDPPRHLAMSMQETLLAADRNKLKRLAVPAISTGVYGYPPSEAIPILVKTAAETRMRLHHLEEIRFVIIDAKMLPLFVQAIEDAELVTSGTP